MMDTGVTQFVFPSKIGAGSRALEHLPFDLGEFGAMRPLVVCTAALDNEGGLKPLESAFRGSGLAFGVYGMAGEPSLETVREAWTHYHDGGFDAIIAVGGGAVMDVAKGLAVAAGTSPEGLRALLDGEGTAVATAPLAWVPTLSVTGREAAPEAFVGGRFLKGTALVPNIIAVDPRMLPSRETGGLAEAGLGVLAASLCLYESGAVSPLILPYARLAARQMMAGLEPLLAPPAEATGWFSRFFGKGAGQDGAVPFVTAMAVSGSLRPEARKSLTFVLADVLAPVSRCSREVLAAVILPSVLEYAHRVRGEELSDLLFTVGDLDLFCATPVQQRAEAAISLVREKLNRLWLHTETELPRTLCEAGIERETLLRLCDEATAMADGWQRHEVESLLLAAYNGTRPDPRNHSARSTQEVS